MRTEADFSLSAFFSFILIFILCVSNADASSKVEALIEKNEWEKAAKFIYLEARDINKYELEIIRGLAGLGDLAEALKTVELSGPTSYKIISLLRSSKNIPLKTQRDLVDSAIEHAYKRSAGSYILSSDLMLISLYLSSLGLNKESSAVFNDSLAIAMKEQTGYQNITNLLYRANKDELESWILEPVAQAIKRELPSKDQAYSCINMISVSHYFRDQELVSYFAECAERSISYIGRSWRKELVSEKLAVEKFKLGISLENDKDSSLVEALILSRARRFPEVYKIIESMGVTLYVDHKWSLYRKVILDAIDRKDIDGALYLARNPPDNNSRVLAFWKQIAEMQIEGGQVNEGYISYDEGVNLLNEFGKRKKIYYSLISQGISLGESMISNGKVDAGWQTIKLSNDLIKKIPDSFLEDKVRAYLHLSQALLRLGKEKKGQRLLLEAYRQASLLDTTKFKGHIRKGRLLSYVAHGFSNRAQVAN